MQISKLTYARHIVREALDALTPTQSRNVVYKPIGLSAQISGMVRGGDTEIAADHYWRVLNDVFPGSYKLFLVRSPVTWVKSACRRWGLTLRAAIEVLNFYCAVLEHDQRQLDFIGSFEDLNSSPSEFVARALPFLDASDAKRCSEYLSRNRFAQSADDSTDASSESSLFAEVSSTFDYDHEASFLGVCRRLELLGFSYPVPEAVKAALAAASQSRQARVGPHASPEILHYKKEADEAWEGRKWFENENKHLRKLVKEKEALCAELDSWTKELEKAKEWNDAERQKWEAEFHKCEAALSESQRWAMKLQEANEALVAERDSLREASLAESEALRKAVD